MHAPLPIVTLYVPIAQGWHDCSTALKVYPGEHWQLEIEVLACPLVDVKGGHLVHMPLDVASLYQPTGHTAQTPPLSSYPGAQRQEEDPSRLPLTVCLLVGQFAQDPTEVPEQPRRYCVSVQTSA